jgi:hypothetical protein
VTHPTPTRRAAALACVVALAAAACSTPGQTPPSKPPRGPATTSALSHATAELPHTTPAPDPAAAVSGSSEGPVAVAAGHLADLLHAQGLEVLWVGTRYLDPLPLPDRPLSAAVVDVDVAHHAGVGHPTQARYRLHLHPADGGWRVTDMTEVE